MAITLVTVCTPLKLLITGTVKYQRVISIKKHSKQLLVTRDIVEEKIKTSSLHALLQNNKGAKTIQEFDANYVTLYYNGNQCEILFFKNKYHSSLKYIATYPFTEKQYQHLKQKIVHFNKL